MAALLVFVVFLVAIAISIPIGASMIVGSLAPIFLMDKGGSIAQLLNNTFSGANSTPILAVPLFILGGVIMAEGGISKKLFNFFSYFVGSIPRRYPLRGHSDLPVLRRHLRFRPRHHRRCGLHVYPLPGEPGV